MIREGAITQAQFEEALTLITFSVLNYRACRFYFFDALDKNVVPEVAIPVPLGGLLLDTVRRAGDLPLEELAHDTELRVMPSQDPLLRYQTVEFNESERRLLACAAQEISKQDLLAGSGLPTESAARALYALLVLGEVVSVEPVPEDPAAAREPRQCVEMPSSPHPQTAQDTVDDYLNHAKQALRAKNFAGSIFWLKKCIEIAPDVAKYHAMLARSLGAIPHYRKDAAHHFNVALQLDPYNTSACFQFGELNEVLGLPWRAVALYKRILEMDPQHAKAMERLAALKAKNPEEKSDKSVLSRFFKRKK